MRSIIVCCLIIFSNVLFAQKIKTGNIFFIHEKNEREIDSLLKVMTLEEKIGQMTQLTAPTSQTGPVAKSVTSEEFIELIRKDKIGSVLNAWGASNTRTLQQVAVKETRLGIPLIFGLDVIHGYETTFPIPLAESASWDLEAITQSARISATEASAAGIHWTFAPMVDITRDPRWGRIAEGAGEDVYLGCLIAKARVQGFQGKLDKENEIIACAKHFVGYGQTEAGKDYNTTDISERALRETYLPPFKACIDAGVGTFMSAFNELNGVPASGNYYTLNQILKKEWNYEGFVVSDWESITEMIKHGAAANSYEAAQLALHAGVDMEMVSRSYKDNIKSLLDNRKITMDQLDESVRKILRLKFALGLFDDPFRFCNEEREAKNIGTQEHRAAAREVAKKSVVLLKNANQLLPLQKNTKTIAVIGHLSVLEQELNGTWAFPGSTLTPVTLLNGIKTKVGSTSQVLYSQGYDLYNENSSLITEAIRTAKRADVLIVSLGESKMSSGEAKCRSSLNLPPNQQALIEALAKTGKPIVVVLTNGRPLTIPWLDKNIPAILESWFLGTETGNALADIIFGDYNPSGKLPVTFPLNIGQVPVYYNHKNTGRPEVGNGGYTSRYLDIPNEPLYPFGYGLSYTSFDYSNIRMNKDSAHLSDEILVSIDLINTGKSAGRETVQFYIRDVTAFGVGRPVKELKGFQQIDLNPGQKKTITFKITEAELSFYRHDMSYGTEPGYFKVFIGGNSRDVKETVFKLLHN